MNAMPPPLLSQLQTAAKRKAAHLGKSRTSILRDAIAGVVQLRRWSMQQSQQQSQLANEQTTTCEKTPLKHAGDQALKQWIIELADIFQDVWKREPGVSKNPKTGEYAGPFFRFVIASKSPLGISRIDQALGKHIQRTLSQMDKSGRKIT